MITLISILALCSLAIDICYCKNSSIPNQVNGNFLNIPYHAQLVQPGDKSFYCGAAIFSKMILITVASCIRSNASYEVLVGSSEYGRGRKHRVAAITLHGKFNEKTLQNDIALVMLNDPLGFKNNVQRIRLSKEEYFDEKTAHSYEFYPGLSNNITAHSLREVAVKVMHAEQCRTLFGINLDYSKICASCEGCDSCQSNPGGLLVRNGKLIGLASRRSVCEHPDLPTVYTNPNSVREFIEGASPFFNDAKKKNKNEDKKKNKKKSKEKGKKEDKKKGKNDSIYYVGLSKKGGKISCGGALVTQKHVLTAEECLKGKGPFEAHVGKEKADIIKTKPIKQSRCLLGLIKKLLGMGNARLSWSQILFPKKNERYKGGEEASVLGYGLMKKSGKPSTKVTETMMPLLDDKQCIKLSKRPNTLCAISKKKVQLGCQGDLGGPVFFKHKLIGIEMECTKNKGPLFFEDLRPLVDIILKEIKTLK